MTRTRGAPTEASKPGGVSLAAECRESALRTGTRRRRKTELRLNQPLAKKPEPRTASGSSSAELTEPLLISTSVRPAAEDRGAGGRG